MGQEAAVAVAVPPPVAGVQKVFSWEHETAMARKQPAAPESLKKPPVARVLSVPPPPGRPAATRMSFSRAVRPEEDPFLAAYLACTKSGGGGCQRRTKMALETKGTQSRRSGWARLGLGLGLSCKRSTSNGVVEESMVRLVKLPELDPRDDA
ncbi:uncharacterized protein LOC100826292 [Brachypodium distachyon]|uniref:Uncharacterized protein n=1 Tax=Brachypodium distachyon TaxID=15368 RepID=A0A0Q3HC27_BRADI|nr:uncharacterized protein LOC100826292 [Brachypodium distachyon]KQJ85651.1 hypothetical protein BRADI_4g00830v3 [Brachypodium distachyon]|eukprot:XP_003579094.1 uncharacterized protein LOC100826292 [Brachypodium distachyon]